MAAKKTFIQVPVSLDEISLRGVLEDIAVRINDLMNGICVDRPLFLATPSSDQSNFAKDTAVDIVFDTEIIDIGNNFASNTFTAPLPGTHYYILIANIVINDIDDSASRYEVRIVGSNRTLSSRIDPAMFSTHVGNWTLSVISVMDMEKDDTAKVQIYQTGGTGGTSDIDTISIFCGFLIA